MLLPLALRACSLAVLQGSSRSTLLHGRYTLVIGLLRQGLVAGVLAMLLVRRTLVTSAALVLPSVAAMLPIVATVAALTTAAVTTVATSSMPAEALASNTRWKSTATGCSTPSMLWIQPWIESRIEPTSWTTIATSPATAEASALRRHPHFVTHDFDVGFPRSVPSGSAHTSTRPGPGKQRAEA